MSNSIVCHVVAGYPNEQESLELIVGLQNAQVGSIEIQIPFSDPIADGEAIMSANDVALVENGMTVLKSFNLIQSARDKGVSTDLYVMSYIQKIQHVGYEEFCTLANRVSISGLIIPDLPIDTKEYEQLRKIAQKMKIAILPVLSPGMPVDRLDSILDLNPSVVYLTTRRGITGTAYSVDTNLQLISEYIRKRTNAKIIIGFGIANSGDVKNALTYGDMAVIGSAIVRRVHDSGVKSAIKFVENITKEIRE